MPRVLSRHTRSCGSAAQGITEVTWRPGYLAGSGVGFVKDLVAGSRIEFADRGEHTLKGVPGTWHLFAAVA